MQAPHCTDTIYFNTIQSLFFAKLVDTADSTLWYFRLGVVVMLDWIALCLGGWTKHSVYPLESPKSHMESVYLARRSFAQTSIFRGSFWDFELFKFSTASKQETDLLPKMLKCIHRPGSVAYIVSGQIFRIMKCCPASGQIPAAIISAENE